MLQLGLNAFVVLTAFLAAWFWLASASVNIPNPKDYYGGEETPDDDPFVVAFKKAGTRNKLAAFFAGLSAIGTAITVLIEK